MPAHAILSDDTRLNYMIVDPPTDEPEISEGCCGLASNKTMTPIEKYIFYIPIPPQVKNGCVPIVIEVHVILHYGNWLLLRN